MSTHTTVLWLETDERNGGHAWVDVASDVSVDLCVRLSVGEGDPAAETAREIHLNLEQAEQVASALSRVVKDQRQRGNDPTWAGVTSTLESTANDDDGGADK